MTNKEFSTEFDILYNSITSNQAPGLDEYEKSVFLTKAQEQLILDYFNPKANKVQEGFDDSQKRQTDFSMIISSAVIKPAYIKFITSGDDWQAHDDVNPVFSKTVPGDFKITTMLELNPFIWEIESGDPEQELHIRGEKLGLINLNIKEHIVNPLRREISNIGNIENRRYQKIYPFYNGKFDSRDNSKALYIDGDIMLILNEYVTVTRAGKEVRLQVVPIQYTEYTRLMTKPFKRPYKNQAWRLLDSSEGHKMVELIIGPDDTLESYNIRYVRKPKPIILCDLADQGLSIDGYTNSSECELDPTTHRELLQRAAELAKASYQGDLNAQIALGQSSQTQIGMVTQSR